MVVKTQRVKYFLKLVKIRLNLPEVCGAGDKSRSVAIFITIQEKDVIDTFGMHR